jgi:orotate phosphoribosyltransferase-like protein
MARKISLGQYAKAHAMRRAGRRLDEIATEIGVSRAAASLVLRVDAATRMEREIAVLFRAILREGVEARRIERAERRARLADANPYQHLVGCRVLVRGQRYATIVKTYGKLNQRDMRLLVQYDDGAVRQERMSWMHVIEPQAAP